MEKTITPKQAHGTVTVPASKSQAHRYLICAALSENESEITCNGISDDIKATIGCLNALGAKIEILNDNLIHVTPIRGSSEEQAHLYCKESGTTLRFMFPLVGVLGRRAVLHTEGNLSKRPSQAFIYELIAHGMSIEPQGDDYVCSGKLLPGMYCFPGDISSQFVSALLLASPFFPSDNIVRIMGEMQSRNYVTMTEDAMTLSGVGFGKGKTSYIVYGMQKYYFPEKAAVEGDWSGAAFFLCMGALSDEGVLVKGLSMESSQGDKQILDILKEFGASVTVSDDGVFVSKGTLKGITVDASMIPDLIPAVCAVAAAAEGVTTITNAARLRMKETDRIKSIAAMLGALGARVTESEDGLTVEGGTLKGGDVGLCKDHRIAMAAAVASCACTDEVHIADAQCVAKSYPAFWEDFDRTRQ